MGQTDRDDEADTSTSVASLIRAANRQGVRASRLLPAPHALLRGVDEIASVDAETTRDGKDLLH